VSLFEVETNSMEQSPSSETGSSSAGQEISRILWDPEGSLPCSQQPAVCPYTEPHMAGPRVPFYRLNIHFNIILLSTSMSS